MDRAEAARIIDDAVEAMKLDNEQKLYRGATSGRGILLVFGAVVFISGLYVALETLPVIFNVDVKYLRMAKYALFIIAIPLGLLFKARRKRRLRPYVISILNQRSMNIASISKTSAP